MKEHKFWANIDVVDQCWLWKGYVGKSGYGYLRGPDSEMWFAHRLSYHLIQGPIPSGYYICHKCDNKTCINPKHLFLGTPQDNIDDMWKKNRQAKDYNHPPQRGENNHAAKVTDADVTTIREMFASGTTQAQLARLFHTTPANIHCIVRNKSRV